jgi:hypothetical protein
VDPVEAVRDESIDFFSSGHPLVEGILNHLEESRSGRVALLHIQRDESGFGLLGLYRQGPQFSAVAIDVEGYERPEWAALLVRRPLRSRRGKPERWTRQPGWPELIRRLAGHLDGRGHPVAIAAFRIGD